jgi:hypothetical protein
MSEEGGGKPTTVLPERGRPGLFEAFGVEIEYMIADRVSLDVMPVCDRLIEAVAGGPESEIERGPIAWSNELTLHVLELKTNGPAPTLSGLSEAFHTGVQDANRALEPFGARLLPGGMHPWMDPGTETRLWPHEYTEVYRTFDRIFGVLGTRLGESSEHAPEPPVRGRRGVRSAARGHPAGASAHSGGGCFVARSSTAEGVRRSTRGCTCIGATPEASPVGGGTGGSGGRLHPRAIRA